MNSDRIKECEFIIEDAITNLQEDLGIQVLGIDFEIVDFGRTVDGTFVPKYKARVKLNVGEGA